MLTRTETKAPGPPCVPLSYPIGQILEAIVELCRDGVNAGLDHAIDSHLELLLGEAEAEPLLECSDS